MSPAGSGHVSPLSGRAGCVPSQVSWREGRRQGGSRSPPTAQSLRSAAPALGGERAGDGGQLAMFQTPRAESRGGGGGGGRIETETGLV